MSDIVIDESKAVCGNCWNVGEVSERHRTTGRPDGWGTSLITTNDGILTNSLVCDLCLTAIKEGLAARRDLEHEKATLGKEVPPVVEEEAPKGMSNRAKQRARAAVNKVETTQKETEAEADKNAEEAQEEEIKAGYAKHEAEIDALKLEEAKEV